MKSKSGLKKNWPAFIHSLVHVRWERGLPRLIIHEQYEQWIKWALRLLWFVAMLSSVATLGPVGGIALSLVLTGIEQFLERAVFRYTTIVVTPLPDFSFSMDELTGMVFAFPAQPEPGLLPCVGFAFAREDLADKFFAVLRRWNYGHDEDRDNNIRLTFVWPKRESGYFVCMFPSPERKGVVATFEEVGAATKERAPGKEQHELVVVWTIRKHLSGGEQFRLFAERHAPGQPFWLQAFESVDGKEPKMLYGVRPILKLHYRVIHEKNLKKTDHPEYSMMGH